MRNDYIVLIDLIVFVLLRYSSLRIRITKRDNNEDNKIIYRLSVLNEILFSSIER